MNDFDKMIQILEKAGYVKADDDADVLDLGFQEYSTANAKNQRMLSLGAGRTGETNCYTNFYFTLDSGELIEHSSNTDDE
jgi:hypothetical protein